MTRTQLHHRERLRERYRTVLERYPQRVGAEFVREMENVAAELARLARDADQIRGDVYERARTWREVAQAWLDLASAGHACAHAEAEAAAARVNALDPSGRADIKALFEQLQGVVEEGKVDMDPVRRAGLEEFMERLAASVERGTAPARSTAGLEDEARLGTLREDLLNSISQRGEIDMLFTEMLARTKAPTLPGPPLPAGSRAARVFARLQELKAFVFASALPMHSDAGIGEPGSAWDLSIRLGRLTTAVHASGGDEQVLLDLECDRARALTAEVRRYARREHLGLARPVWSQRTAVADPNTLFFSGPASTGEALGAMAARRRLVFNARPAPGVDAAEARWRELAGANLAVFDLSERDPQVFYELGAALVLGTELLLLTRTDRMPPFDIAQNVCTYHSEAALETLLEPQLDAALYGVQAKGGQGESLTATLSYTEHVAQRAVADAHVGVSLRLMRDALHEPRAFGAALANFNACLARERFVIVAPRWPMTYADPDRPRCFVVMPFARELEATQATYRSIAAACERAGINCVRGDVAQGQEIIRSIWEETGWATHVLVDLTGFNPNVCLELGIADALGKNTLLIAEAGTEARLFTSIAKRRCHPYGNEGWGDAHFAAIVSRFLEGRLPV